MLPCSMCDAFAVVVMVVVRVDDGATVSEERYCYDHAVARGVPGAEPAPKLVATDSDLGHEVTR